MGDGIRQIVVVLQDDSELLPPSDPNDDDSPWEREDLEWGRRWTRPCPTHTPRRLRPSSSRGPSSIN